MRPEVGFLGSCTATLITTQAFVSAAHCFGYEPEVEGGEFLIEHGEMDKDWVPIEKTYSLHNALGRLDVAIGFLAEKPLGWPHGARMVSSLDFGDDEKGTRIGYGCTETTHFSGQGVKRFRHTYGRSTDVSCPFDSGGPHFKGGIGDGGPLYAVASKYDAGPDPGDDTNAFVNALWAEGMIRWKNSGFEVGLDRYGFDYAWVEVDSASACRTLCRKDPRCEAFTYDGDVCHLKNLMGPTSPHRDMTSGPGVGRFRGDLLGADYTWYAVERDDICEADCARDPACKAWTFAGGTCHLKDAQPEVTTCNTCWSGYRKNGLEHNVNRPGSDWRVITTSSASQCANECVNDAVCDSFTFSPVKRCYLKVSAPGPVSAVGYVSGVRRGIEYNVNRPGSVYYDFGTAPGKERMCQAACLADSQCRSWSYFTAVNGQPTCYLRNAVPARDERPGVMSGVPGMEFF